MSNESNSKVPQLDIKCDHKGVNGTKEDPDNIYHCTECCPDWKTCNVHKVEIKYTSEKQQSFWVDKALVAKFKAAAQFLGIQLKDAFAEAMKMWLRNKKAELQKKAEALDVSDSGTANAG